MIHLLRANHANEFELQNYAPIAKKLGINVITSQHPLTPISLPTVPLWSPTDLPHIFFRRQILNRLIGGEQWLLGIEKLVKPGDIVHTAETYTPYTHQAVQLRKSGIISKLICTCWETIPHNNEKLARLRAWKKEAYQYVDLFHTPTARAKDALISEGVDQAKVVVIPYGVDLTRFKPARLKTKNNKLVVLMVARPVYEKGVDIFRAVASELADLADFRLVSNAKYSEMPSIYQTADFFFLPSRSTATWEEQYGMALVEAMACGLPIITTSTGAIPEVVGSAGITYPVRDVNNMIKSIRALIQNPDLCQKYSSHSLSRARRHYDSHKISAKLAALYR